MILAPCDILAGRRKQEGTWTGYRTAAAALGVPAGECLVVEDAEAGLEAGRAAGARTAALRGLDGDVRLTGLADLVPHFAVTV